MLNIAEGYSRFSLTDRKNFYVIARGSIFECVAIFYDLLLENLLETELHQEVYFKLEELSKMIFSMISNLGYYLFISWSFEIIHKVRCNKS